MIHERFADWIPDAERYIREKKEVITRASRIIAISENTKKDIVELLHIDPEKIDVIYHSTSMKPHTGRFNLKLPEHFVLYVGERSLYKNFWRFMKAFVKLREVYPDLYVVCTGRRFDAQERAAIEELGLGECLLCLKASDKELGELYARALCFVYPSLYEGLVYLYWRLTPVSVRWFSAIQAVFRRLQERPVAILTPILRIRCLRQFAPYWTVRKSVRNWCVWAMNG